MKSQVANRALVLTVVAVTALLAAGCVERIARIQTDPPGAFVLVNDEEVGVSPVRFSFLWYGDYDIVLRKPGYETLKTHYQINAPWYQYPPIDLIVETMVPTMIRDERVLPTLVLEPAEPPATEDLVDRAVELREQALFKMAQ